MLIDVAALSTDPLVGTRYRVVRLIGGGLSADVYEATGPSGELHAIKVLRHEMRDSQDAAARLLQEGRLLASLRHPNLVPLREMGMTRDGRPFLAMPRLPGETLRETRLRQGALAPAFAASLVAGALDGLHAAHRHGVVHRDVKPGNIFLIAANAGPPRPAMIDFGIAKVSGAAVRHTTDPQFILGTPRYIAPEQILDGRVDARTDVYAMGIVLFECIAARGPFDLLAGSDLLTVMRAHLGLAPRRLDDVANVPSALACVVARALEKKPARRYPTAAAFAAAIRGAVAPEAFSGAERRAS
ncbi:serine/threonine-protein kinase [Polyangium mundeleinium]|uniref:Serine/threonine-protein kinase n=1 Tax=Polyangium mundeleinium TaxID=2995306 RepID=A0ABT5EF64_9BACT|nr:serine/threonine-protein kinase [Polyangium mundeleinium]MDC0740094.1 serine/threonine-protein kinase [Polyangium mundeleinium]